MLECSNISDIDVSSILKHVVNSPFPLPFLSNTPQSPQKNSTNLFPQDSWWIGISNAIAAGMMIAASYSLCNEGINYSSPQDYSTISSFGRTIIGIIIGLAFIMLTKKFLESYEHLKVSGLNGANTKKVLLIIFVMTLHSFSEGVGIGVSFGGASGTSLGVFISASLAVHNIPEGLAVAIVLLPRKMNKLDIALWCILTSIPQPIMAVPSFLFVEHFIPILPVGLGFAGGAMFFVAFFELLVEAVEETNWKITGVVSFLSLGFMIVLQNFIHG